MRQQDFEVTGMGGFLEAWFREFPAPGDPPQRTLPIVSADLFDAITERTAPMQGPPRPLHQELTDAASEVFGDLRKLDPSILGRRLRHWTGRILEGYRLRQEEQKTNRGKAWFVERVTRPGTTEQGEGVTQK